MKVTQRRKLETAMTKLQELASVLEDRTEEQSVLDALEHLAVAKNDPPPSIVPMPHNVSSLLLNPTPIATTQFPNAPTTWGK